MLALASALREISGEAELNVINRGDHSEIDIFPGEPLDNKLSGNVIDLCPVGAASARRISSIRSASGISRPRTASVPAVRPAAAFVETNKDVLFRLRPPRTRWRRSWFMCDEGRYGYHHVNSKERLSRPLIANQPSALSRVIDGINQDFSEAASRHSGQCWLVLSPFLTCEERIWPPCGSRVSTSM